MHKTFMLFSPVLLMLASTLTLDAASLAGVNLPDTATVGGKSLVLNGLGVRSEFMVKVYVGGLYLEQKSTDADAIIKTDAPKRIVMHFLHDASKKQMTDAFSESFKTILRKPRQRRRPRSTSSLARLSPSKLATRWSSPTCRQPGPLSLSMAQTR